MGTAGNHIEPGSEADAPGEDDVDFVQYNEEGAHDPVTPAADLEDSDMDADGEEVDEEDFGAPGTVNPALAKAVVVDKQQEDDDIDAEGDEDVMSEVSLPIKSDDEDDDSLSDSSQEAAGWQEGSEEGDEIDTSVAEPNLCMFCNQDEEHDPGEEFEEYLRCRSCERNSHRQCAREADCLDNDEDAKEWRCKSCEIEGPRQDRAASQQSDSTTQSPVDKADAKASAPLHQRGDKHSSRLLFATDEDTLDGSRSLRKRKVSDDDELPRRPVRKRRRPSATVSPSARSSPATSRKGDVHMDGTDSQAGSPRPRSSRMRRQVRQRSERPLVEIRPSNQGILVLSFNLDRDRVQKILSGRPRPKRLVPRERDRSKKKIQPPIMQEPEPPHYPPLPSTYNSAMFYALNDREQDDPKAKPYGGILTETEADTTRTFPHPEDKKKFEEARLKAEEDWKKKVATMNIQPEPTKPSQKLSGPPSKIKCISFGGFEIDTWHAAPYPEEYSRNKVLYICEFCLKYMNSDYVAWRHKLKCPAKHPPGDEIYRDGKYSFFEVDGRKNTVYCQNLCLLAKLFLGSKTLYYDVDPFLFYVMTENDDLGCHFVGYFSKEKRPSSMNNVSCILVLPIYQRRGFGHYLIEFSYLLTRVENKTGSPEKPLSDMGLVSYRGYWRLVMCYQLLKQRSPVGISMLSERTGMTADDIVSALEGLRALVRDPVTKNYALRLDYTYFKEYIDKYEAKGYPKINPDALIWVPYVMNRGMEKHFEDGPTLHTVAQREEDDEELDQQDYEEGLEEPLPNGLVNGDSGKHATDGSKAQDDTAMPDADAPATEPIPEDTEIKSTRSSPRRSPSKRSHSRLNTPQAGTINNGTSDSTVATSIPPSRYEVFPPIPGMSTTARRRPGRPFGSRTRHKSAMGTGTPIKRTNSHLVNGISAMTPETASRRASSRRPGSANGRATGAHSPAASSRITRRSAGREIELEEDPEAEEKDEQGEHQPDDEGDEDADGDEVEDGEDEDAEGEEVEDEDLDAEGEDEE